MTADIWFAPAKLNLFLHIVGRRADGYHELQTVFQLLDYSDELSFELRKNDPHIQLTISYATTFSHIDIGDIEHNLVMRAAKLLQKFSANPQQGAAIHLHKKIPIGGGLGGGSSDAATTLIALNQLWQVNLSIDELSKLGLQLGADVPMFIHGKSAWGEGVGEYLTPIPLPESWFLVIVPPCTVTTTEIFSATELTRNTSPITIQQFLNGPESTHNDCEAVVRTRYPIIAEALNWLNQFAPARLTGTGSCLYAAFAHEDEARSVAEKIPAPLQGFVTKGLSETFWGVAKR